MKQGEKIMATPTRRQSSALQHASGDNPFQRIRQELESAIQGAFGETGLLQSSTELIPRMDVSETDGEIEVRTDLPGFKPEEVNIEIHDNYLTISGSHSEEQKEEDKERRYHRIERRSGSFSRSVALPCAVKQDAVDAELKEGVLRIRLPKSEEARSRKIPVKG
jgi:HSP20 family protein